MKNLKIFGASLLCFAIISTFTVCREDKQREEKKKVKLQIDNYSSETLFEPVEEIDIPEELIKPIGTK